MLGALAMPGLRAGPNLLRNVARRGNLMEISRSGSSGQHAARELVSNPHPCGLRSEQEEQDR